MLGVRLPMCLRDGRPAPVPPALMPACCCSAVGLYPSATYAFPGHRREIGRARRAADWNNRNGKRIHAQAKRAASRRRVRRRPRRQWRPSPTTHAHMRIAHGYSRHGDSESLALCSAGVARRAGSLTSPAPRNTEGRAPQTPTPADEGTQLCQLPAGAG